MKPTQSFWSNKRVLITGHTGFKGSWLALWLYNLGATVTGISLPPNTKPNLFTLSRLDEFIDSEFADIRNAEQLASLVKQSAPEIIFHLAAQPLVRASYRKPLETFATNIMGTAHLLESLRSLNSIKVAVIVTTDKVYANREWLYPYRENDMLGGHDPYSASKAASEIITASYRDSFLSEQGVTLATARAGNVIGGGDWSEDRLLPDAIKAWGSGIPIKIRSPQAVRPWQHVLEPLAGYLTLAQHLWSKDELAGAYNFGPEMNEAATVKKVIDYSADCFGPGSGISYDSCDGPHESKLLALEISKTRIMLGIEPRWSLFETIERTINWYKKCAQGTDARDLCFSDLQAFGALP